MLLIFGEKLDSILAIDTSCPDGKLPDGDSQIAIVGPHVDPHPDEQEVILVHHNVGDVLGVHAEQVGAR